MQASTCQPCSSGTYSGQGASLCTNCSAGQYSPPNASGCSPCQAGYWSSQRFSSCTSCPGGTYSAAVGASSSSACNACPAGTNSSASGASSQLNCTWCPAGTYSRDGATSCVQCQPNTYSVLNSSNCIGCPAFSDSPGGGGLGNCVCRPGYLANLSAWPFACQACVPGTYSASYNSSACTGCQAGKYGTSSVANSSSWGCSDCPAGLFSTGGQTECTACEAGSYAPTGTTTCVTCKVGTWANASASACTACSAGKYSTSPASSSSTVCTPCAAGTYSTSVGSSNATDCMSCAAGGSSMAGAVSCSKCPANTFADAFSGLDKCTPCPANSTSQNGSTANDCLCSTGLFAFYRTKAIGGIESYSVSATGDTYRTHTFIGPGTMVVLADIQVILQCGASTFVSSAAFPPGTYDVPSGFAGAAAPGLCQTQSVIFYKVNGAFDASQSTSYFTCSPCHTGQYKSMTGQGSCMDCAAGTYQNTVGATSCVPCPPASTSLPGQASCRTCSAGTYFVGNNTCAECDAGKYNPYEGGVACQTCGEGLWSGPGSSACSTCPDFSWGKGGTDFLGCLAEPGLYMDTSFSVPVCGLCFEGTYSTGGATACTNCLPGTYQDLTQSSSCVACSPGWISQTPASTTCTQCQYGYTTASGQAECVECPLTYYCPPTGGVMQCPPGTHVDKAGLGSLDECLPCPADYVCTDYGIAQPCPANTHSPPGSTSMTACVCEVGFSCSYTKAMQASIYLPMTAAQFAAQQAEFIRAVAAAAGVSPDRVIIDAVIPFTKPLGSRRGLARRKGPIIRVVTAVKGYWTTRGLEEELYMRGLPMPLAQPVMKRHHFVSIQETRSLRR